MGERLREYCHSAQAEMRVDRQRAVIRGVKVLGLRSRNGRVYTEDALRRAAPLYEGAKVNVNHPRFDPTAPRDYQERLGVMRGVCFRVGEGLYGDLHYNPNHPVAEQLVWDAQHAPENVGLSHHVVALTRRDGDALVVESISKVESVDLVADPATTSGLFEARECMTTGCLPTGQGAPHAGDGLPGDGRATNAYVMDAGLEVATASAKRDAGGDALATLTVEQLRRARPDLIEAILIEQTRPLETDRLRNGVFGQVSASAGSQNGATAAGQGGSMVAEARRDAVAGASAELPAGGGHAAAEATSEDRRRLALEVDRLRAERALLHRRFRVRQMLVEHGLPDPELAKGSQRELVSDCFVEHLLSLPDETLVREAIGERARLARAASGLRPRCRDQLLIEDRSQPRDVGQFVAAIRG